MKRILTLILILFFSGNLLAQQEETVNASRQLGLSYSSLGGAGIHYIVPTTENDNIKFTGILIYRDDAEARETFFSIGAEYQRDLVEGNDKRAYFTTGAHIDNQLSNTLYFDYYDNDSSSRVGFFNAGIGLGFDYGNITDGIILNIHLSYQLTTGFGDVDRTRVGLGGGLGIGFNF
ncbi:MAG: hypothetical protein CL666_02925 [Balneola sp.]|nr:hypothetical protein [Balneola sp.]|tara:strand:+ start:20220 stop:20747 length:528 start_codon:yes stop_codon:yes gene_type:complete